MRASDGKLITTPKDRLKKQLGPRRGRGTNLRITIRACENEHHSLAAGDRQLV